MKMYFDVFILTVNETSGLTKVLFIDVNQCVIDVAKPYASVDIDGV